MIIKVIVTVDRSDWSSLDRITDQSRDLEDMLPAQEVTR